MKTFKPSAPAAAATGEADRVRRRRLWQRLNNGELPLDELHPIGQANRVRRLWRRFSNDNGELPENPFWHDNSEVRATDPELADLPDLIYVSVAIESCEDKYELP